jgi:pyruvate dehydrogenase E2 component (dihydrolipoamide acetyltransferase)
MRPIIMPKAGQLMEEGLVLRWLKHEGQPVDAGEIVLEIETDKAVVEVPSEQAGVLRKILIAEGQLVPVTTILAYVGSEGEVLPETRLTDIEAPERSSSRVPPPSSEVLVQPARSNRAISPRAKKLAVEHQIDLGMLTGSGPGGRITEADVTNFLNRSKTATHRPRTLSKGQQATGKLLQHSVQTAPHFFLVMDVDMEQALELRATLKTELRVTITDLMVKAAGRALVDCPEVNCRWDAESIVYNDFINVGVAVDAKGELLTATIAQVDNKPLLEVAKESRAAIEKAKTGFENGLPASLTISNLGMYGVRQFTAIIPPPAVAILAVGEVTTVSQALTSGASRGLVKRVTVTLSCDHRALNGVQGARFLQSVKANLEQPELWLHSS